MTVDTFVTRTLLATDRPRHWLVNQEEEEEEPYEDEDYEEEEGEDLEEDLGGTDEGGADQSEELY